MHSPATKSGRKRLIWLVAGVILAALAAYVAIPRRADLTRFDPAAMAALETAMWRHYYEKRYLPLAFDLYETARREQGYSPLDSVRIAVAAARAAKVFQPSTSRTEAEAAMPYLTDYFGLLADAAEVARTELAWWQARREAVPPEQYGPIIARVTTLLYGVDNADVRRAGLIRAQAMDYRDAHAAGITEADWAAIERELALAYGLLKKAVASAARPD
jgi:hypothetical protein